jgi:hypothetical protein
MNGRIFGWSLMAAVGLAGFAATASTESLNVKTGLWEVTSTAQSSGMPFDLSTLPADQRAKIEAAMKAQMAERGKPRITRECITKEKLEKDLFTDKDLDPSCKRTTIASTATLQELKLECSGRQPMTGTLHFEAVDPSHVRGTIKMVAGGPGQTMNVDSTFTAKWIGADCGDVK